MRYEVVLGDRRLAVEVDPAGRVLVDDRAVAAEVRETAPGRSGLVLPDGAAHEVVLLGRAPLRLQVGGVEVGLSAADARVLAAGRAAGGAASARVELRAPMPGLVKTVHVREGDTVEEGEAVLTLEAMKMENELRAPARARVERIAVAAGTKVEGGALLAVLVAAP